MKVQFQFTAADLADVTERITGQSRVARNWRWEGTWTWAFLLGLVLYLLLPGAAAARAAFALVFCILIGLLYPSISKRSRSKRLSRYFEERMRGTGPFTCEVEISPDAIVTRQSGAETRRRWSQVESIREATGGIEVVWRGDGMLLVRDRAFSSLDERRQFVEMARSYSAANRVE